jgi:hypothetical protein
MRRAHLSSILALALAASVGAAGCGEDLPPPPAITGAACATTDAATFAAMGGRIKTVQFNDITFRRRSGHVSCRAYAGSSVCHLSAPRILHVSRAGRDWWFAPGAGERVILATSRAGARCVIDKVQTTEAWAREHMGLSCEAARIRDCP